MMPNRATSDPPPACADFVALVQRFLDGELGPEALATHPHGAACADCRSLAIAARMLKEVETSPIAAPPELANRIVASAMRDHRIRRRRRLVGRAAALTLAASVLLAGIAYLLRPANESAPALVQKQPPVHEPPVHEAPPRMADQVADAGDALAALTRHAADQTVTPARHLVPPAESVSWPSAELPTVEPAVESLAEMPDAARAGFEPMANTTRRAVSLFLRDVGLGQPDKPRS